MEVINAPGFLGNGTNTVSVPNGAVSSMKILLGDAADALTVEATADRIQVQAGAGNDTITLVGTGGTLDGIQGRVSVAGEDGSDVLTVNDQGAAAGKGYTLTASSLTRAGNLLVDSYGTLERVNLNTTGLNDTIVVRSTAASTAVTVNAGFGDDTLTVANASGGLDGILGSARVQRPGRHQATYSSSTTPAAAPAGPFVVKSSSVCRAGSRFISYVAAESVVVKAGAFDDTFDVRSTLAGTPVTLNTGDGSDVVRVGNSVYPTLDYIQGALTVNGQAGSGDVLTIGDVGSTVGRTYTVTSASVSRPGAALIKYGTVESVVVDGTAYDDTFYVQSTAAGTSVTLREGAGNDGLLVGSNPDNPATRRWTSSRAA